MKYVFYIGGKKHSNRFCYKRYTALKNCLFIKVQNAIYLNVLWKYNKKYLVKSFFFTTFKKCIYFKIHH